MNFSFASELYIRVNNSINELKEAIKNDRTIVPVINPIPIRLLRASRHLLLDIEGWMP